MLAAMKHAEQIGRLLNKLALLRAHPVDSFGAESHRFTLRPPLSLEAVMRFEEQHGVVLPDGFREFVLLAGGSGAGPYYGLYAMDRWDDVEWEEPFTLAVRRPFLLTPASTEADVEALRENDEGPFAGAMAIGTQGCSFATLLVVSGEARGRVVYVCRDGGPPHFVEPPLFLDWYERWLDELLAGHRHHWFGYGMPGMEPDLARVAGDVASPRRADALFAMVRLPSLAPETVAIITAAVADPDRDTRRGALAAARQHGLAARSTAFRAALGDAEPEVRVAALRALAEHDPDWIRLASAALRDTDPEVVKTAVWVLGSELIEADALWLLEHARDRGVVESVLARLGSHLCSERVAVALFDWLQRSYSPPGFQCLVAQVRAGVAPEHARAWAFDRVLRRIESHAEGVRSLAAFVTAANASRAERAAAVAALVSATRSPDAFARFDAAGALGDLAQEEAARSLVCTVDVRAALVAMASDDAMPRRDSVSTAWSVGENARRALRHLGRFP